MIVKIHKNGDKKIIAICDSDLIGKKFEQGKLQLDLTSDFYKGDEKPESDIARLIKSAHILNLVGKNSVSLAIKEKMLDEKNIIKIKNIPHAQIVC